MPSVLLLAGDGGVVDDINILNDLTTAYAEIRNVCLRVIRMSPSAKATGQMQVTYSIVFILSNLRRGAKFGCFVSINSLIL